ncbi:Ppx/GppA phosphatase family protein [Promicromonospora iranensis]|uniref:Exopolyphosphatase/guanosine-5'-triphosphate, 3'-diphosphate pyrophosphatase n=1 Tax=Promicromonospora iranensis TaxID=1105144 RepID=A0ABU2CRM7_9MICO|nr:Ppx/GppA phosphatase family protein [Promicromonospora iranensis]MDR7383979.1 exopolyphosphatase/guanosine-5'-triphosphate,3'-diphosphate pyrophosphatase [Promicromonospora iranensis]
MTFSRVAAIDCGTNSIRLLLADVDAAGNLTELDRRMEVVRLGQGVDRTGELAPEALARTLAATREYAAAIEAAGAQQVRFVATSATRDARNRDEFFDGVRAALGVDVEVITGSEEAELSFRGATGAVAEAHAGPFLVVDLGGGSTELVLGTGSVDASVSMDIGSVRMTERHLHSDPPSAAEIEAARADVRAHLDDAARVVPLAKTATLVGLAGSITTVTAHALGLTEYRRERVNQAELPVQTVLDSCAALVEAPRAERVAMGFLHPGRVDVIAAGALVWSEVISRVASDVAAAGGSLTSVVTSEHDILDGIALSMA